MKLGARLREFRPSCNRVNDNFNYRRSLKASTIFLALAACTTPMDPEQKAAEVARAENAMQIFTRGCIDTSARTSPAIGYFKSQGFTLHSPTRSNSTGVHTPDLSKGAFVAAFTGPGYNSRACGLVVDNVSNQTGARAWYAVSRAHFKDSGTSVPPRIERGGSLPRFKSDGSFEAIRFDTGPNEDTGNPAFLITYIVGKTSLPLRELESGRLYPEKSSLGTRLQ